MNIWVVSNFAIINSAVTNNLIAHHTECRQTWLEYKSLKMELLGQRVGAFVNQKDIVKLPSLEVVPTYTHTHCHI